MDSVGSKSFVVFKILFSTEKIRRMVVKIVYKYAYGYNKYGPVVLSEENLTSIILSLQYASDFFIVKKQFMVWL